MDLDSKKVPPREELFHMQEQINRCPRCGAILKSDMNFCANCGLSIASIGVTSTVGNASPSPNYNYYYPQGVNQGLPNNQKRCKKCGQVIPKQAKICPYCHKKQNSKVGIVIGVIAVFIGFAVLGSIFGGTGSDENPSNSVNISTTEQSGSSEKTSSTQETVSNPLVGVISNSKYQNDYFNLSFSLNRWTDWEIYSKQDLVQYDDGNEPEKMLETNRYFTDFYAQLKDGRDYIDLSIYDLKSIDMTVEDFIANRINVFADARKENWNVSATSEQSDYKANDCNYPYGKTTYFLDGVVYGYDGFLVIEKEGYAILIQAMSIEQDHVDEYMDALFGGDISEISYISYEDVTAGQLLDDLDNNALQAATTYKGKTLAIRGKLDNIDAQGDYIALIGEDDMFGFPDVQCFIKDDATLQKVLELSKGEIIVVYGEVTNVGEVLGYSVEIHDIKKTE